MEMEMEMMEIDHEMKMVCECYYIPKDEIIGEDAHFVCEDKQIIGVADGIGGWAKRGIDAGEYARQLMNRCINAIVDNDITHPRQILEEAFMANAKANIQGSSTACILRLNNGVLHAVNVGDSGFMLFRNNKFIYRSPTQQWRFNAPYQLGNSSDTPECAVEVKIAVIPGDIIILGTDGLFDNMFVSDIEGHRPISVMLFGWPNILVITL